MQRLTRALLSAKRKRTRHTAPRAGRAMHPTFPNVLSIGEQNDRRLNCNNTRLSRTEVFAVFGVPLTEGASMTYMRFICTAGHDPTMWSSVRSVVLPENCPECGALVEPHQISKLPATDLEDLL